MHKITQDEVRVVCAVLAAVNHIHVDAELTDAGPHGTVNVKSLNGAVAEAEETSILRAFNAASDARINYIRLPD